ncbi:hypothetical protein CDL15_Pgr016870 [Punica granatum]|uniref:Taxadiene 5-alpha hydroxylase-like n=1 Tax=Punica granatum TaxID=22663 RepID=A0A218WXW2_PUNGR|nr:hypothetical protein CDL15_Pgr016870 [Punica granatum]
MNLPRGSMGYPVIGETLSFLKAQAKDEGPSWFEERIAEHGPVFKTSLMGSPTVVIMGQAGNKFIFTAREDVLVPQQPLTLRTIAGKQNISELSGSRRVIFIPLYRLVKGAMMNFLKPESLQHSVKRMDEIIKNLFVREVAKAGEGGDTIVKAVVFMKKLTFNVACDILFGIKDESTEQALFDDFTMAFKAVWSLPINLPGTEFWRGIKARSRIVDRILPIMRERRKQLERGTLRPGADVVSCLLATRDENGEGFEEEAITDNFIILMIASHDTSAILASLMIWKLSKDPNIYDEVLQEQMEVKRRKQSRGGDGRLTWEDIQSMKFTWRVAQELMRIIPPVFGNFKKALQDLSFGGYDIPKGWQVFWAAYGTQMNGDIFENPDEFNPFRFDNPSKAKAIPPFTYVPFGAGVRMCPGNEFARVETLVIMHNLVTMYEWSQVNPEEAITRQPMPYPSMGLPIRLKPINTN